MTTSTRTFAAALAFAALACGCTRTVVVQQPTTSNNSIGVPTTGAPTSVSAVPTGIGDKSRVCNLFSSRGKEMARSIDALNSSIDHDNWSWSESNISIAGDKVIDTVHRAIPVLKNAVGTSTPSDLAPVLQENIKAFQDFSDGVEQRLSNSDFKPLGEALLKAENDFNAACGFKSN